MAKQTSGRPVPSKPDLPAERQYQVTRLAFEGRLPSHADCCAEAGVPDLGLGHELPNAPVLASIVDRAGMPQGLATQFLIDRARRSRSTKGDSVRTYAEALIPWIEFLYEHRRDYEGATEELLQRYIADLSFGSREGEHARSEATARLYASVACSFHVWGEQSRRMPSPLGEFLMERRVEAYRRPRLPNGHIDWRGPLLPPVAERLPRALTRSQIARLLEAARMPYRLMFRWAITTGLRRFEVCGLTVKQVSGARAAYANEGLAQLEITRKGGRNRYVYMPVQILDETIDYIVQTAPQRTDQEHVFLGPRGEPLSRGAVTREFRRCADLIGSDATLHHLRHTFAVRALPMLERISQGNPVKTLQILMGHASVESTEIYLRASSVNSEAVMKTLNFLYEGVSS